jgi:hypothetical protein
MSKPLCTSTAKSYSTFFLKNKRNGFFIQKPLSSRQYRLNENSFNLKLKKSTTNLLIKNKHKTEFPADKKIKKKLKKRKAVHSLIKNFPSVIKG